MTKPSLPQQRGAKTGGRTTFLIVALLTVAAMVAGFVWVVARRRNPQSTLHAVVYQVGGSATQATVIYLRPDGQSDATVSVPWSSPSFRTGWGMTLSLVTRATDGGATTCVITEDGRPVTTHSGPDCALEATS